MKKMFLIAAICLLAVGVKGQGPAKVPAYKGLIERVQPNGDTLRTYLRGDEWSHYMMTEDGWQIEETKGGWYKYVKTNKKGQVKIGCRKAKNAEKRSKCEKRWLEKHGVKKDER